MKLKSALAFSFNDEVSGNANMLAAVTKLPKDNARPVFS